MLSSQRSFSCLILICTSTDSFWSPSSLPQIWTVASWPEVELNYPDVPMYWLCHYHSLCEIHQNATVDYNVSKMPVIGCKDLTHDLLLLWAAKQQHCNFMNEEAHKWHVFSEKALCFLTKHNCVVILRLYTVIDDLTK